MIVAGSVMPKIVTLLDGVNSFSGALVTSVKVNCNGVVSPVVTESPSTRRPSVSRVMVAAIRPGPSR
jgi:hypothetical protein